MRKMMWLPASVCAAALGMTLLMGCAGGAPATEGGSAAQTDTSAQESEEQALWVLSKETSTYESDGAGISEVTYELDEWGNRITQTTTLEGADPIEIRFELDEDGYPVHVTGSSGDVEVLDEDVTSEMDEQGRLVHRAMAGTEMTYAYGEDGSLSTVTIEEAATDSAGEATTVVKLGEDGFVTERRQEFDGTMVVSTYAYERDDQGRPTKATCTSIVDDNPESETTSTYAYTYDDNGNLAEVAVEGLSGSTKTTYEYVLVENPSPAARHTAEVAQV